MIYYYMYPYQTPISCPYTLRFVNPYPKPNLKLSSIRNSRLTNTEISHDSGMSFGTGNSEYSTRPAKRAEHHRHRFNECKRLLRPPNDRKNSCVHPTIRFNKRASVSLAYQATPLATQPSATHDEQVQAELSGDEGELYM